MADYLFFIYIGLLYLDWLTTMVGLQMGGGESNKLMKFFFDIGFGWSLLITFTVTIPPYIFRDRIGFWGWVVLLGYPMCAVLNNLYVIKKIEGAK